MSFEGVWMEVWDWEAGCWRFFEGRGEDDIWDWDLG